MSVFEAVEAELDRLGAGLAGSVLAATALVLAAELDDEGNSATSKSLCARALSETMDRLRELAPREERDSLDDLTARRESRRGGADSTVVQRPAGGGEL